MAGLRSRRSIFIKVVSFLLVVTVVFAVLATATVPPADSHSDVASEREMICHSDVAADCYPKVFEPTTEFRHVHEDQDLPPGLHVRLNIYTGLREAKLNDPSEDLPAGLAGLPVDSSVVLVDPPEGGVDAETVVAIPKGAPAYDPVGVVKDPGAQAGGEGSSSAITFHESIALVKGVAIGQVGIGPGQVSLTDAEHSRFLQALVEIDDVAHDVYYGLKLAEDHILTRQLLCLMSGGRVATATAVGDGHTAAQKASAAVAAATQNNPSALREIAKQWNTYKTSLCVPAGGDTTTTLGDVVFGPYGNSTAWTRSRLLALNGLLKSEVVIKDFLAHGGLSEVLQLLVEHEGDPAYDAVRRRAAHLVHDNFLDAGMGADVSLWPESAVVPAAPCNGNLHGQCWNHHMQQLAKVHKRDEGHWSHELLKGLQQRKASKGGKMEL